MWDFERAKYVVEFQKSPSELFLNSLELFRGHDRHVLRRDLAISLEDAVVQYISQEFADRVPHEHISFFGFMPVRVY